MQITKAIETLDIMCRHMQNHEPHHPACVQSHLDNVEAIKLGIIALTQKQAKFEAEVAADKDLS
jgi:hypothetical protein